MSWLDALKEAFPDADRISTGSSVLDLHAQDFSYLGPYRPDVVVWPESTDEVQRIVQVAHQWHVPITAFGQGTGIEGHALAVSGGITMDFSRMNRIIRISPEDFTVTVQPGLTRQDLNRALAPHGVFFPIDPGANASIGGMVATNAAGTEALRYGAMRTQVLSLEVVFADGTVARLGKPTMKSSAGYGLVNLMVGSEGTLALFTEITLRVHPRLQHEAAARVTFPTLEDAGQAALDLIGSSATHNRIELMDDATVAAVNQAEGTNFPVAVTLLLEFGSHHRQSVEADLLMAEEVALDHHGKDWEVAWTLEKRRELWHARHQAALAILAATGAPRPFTTDTAVPLSELAPALTHARSTLQHYGIPGAVLGHVGDGNYHIVMGIHPNNKEELERAQAINDAVIRYAWAHGGTLTGEHGIGIGKTKYLAEEVGEAAPFFERIKIAFDPENLFNPGKTVPFKG